MSVLLQRQIEKLKRMILALGARIEESVRDAVAAIETRDPELARRVIDGDDEIDRMEVDIEEECLHTLALHQPVAFDLRLIVSVLKINNELERIGDLATSMAERAYDLLQLPPLTPMPMDLPAVASNVRKMLKTSLDALVNLDGNLAQSVRATDDLVDDAHRRMFPTTEQRILARPADAPQCLQMLNVSRHLERVADHAANIAKDVIYLVSGDIVRHRKKLERYKALKDRPPEPGKY